MMTLVDHGNGVGPFPYLFALLLSVGSLLTYLVNAVVSRYILTKDGRTVRSFNLGIPATQTPETLFAISLAAAQTTFSTVFVVFLTGAAGLGLHLLYCPLAFAVGNWFMLLVYKRIDGKGYVDQSSISGLIPYLVYRFTGSRLVSSCVTAICVLPIVAILALELHYGIPILDHLVQKAFPSTSFGSLGSHTLSAAMFSFGIFACFMASLLGYVFVGGFRAVVTSDVWQYRIMATTLFLILVSVVALALRARHNLSWGMLGHSPTNIVAFYVGVTIVDLFQPLCFATTWQRFRAFRDCSTDFTLAVKRATVRVAYLWIMLILIGVGLQLVSPAPPKEDLAHFLDRVAGLNIWFQLFVFPLVILAGFSGMYSSSDTCVSALLYLTETNRAWQSTRLRDDAPLRGHYYWVIAAVFTLTSCMYVLVKQTSLDPARIALTIFGNTVVLAPTILLLTKLAPCTSKSEARIRSAYVGMSLGLGFLVYWVVTVAQPDWAIGSGLLMAAGPAYLFLARERRSERQERIEANV